MAGFFLRPEHLERIAKRACSFQGMPEAHWDKLPPETRQRLTDGLTFAIQALDSLGFRFELPPGWK